MEVVEKFSVIGSDFFKFFTFDFQDPKIARGIYKPHKPIMVPTLDFESREAPKKFFKNSGGCSKEFCARIYFFYFFLDLGTKISTIDF